MTNSHTMETVPRQTIPGGLLLLVGFVVAAFTHTSAAQTPPGERWFQVELIAFARQVPDQQEHWVKDIKPAYPLNWIELKDATATPGTSDANRELPPENRAAMTSRRQEDTGSNSRFADDQTPIDIDRTPFVLLPNNNHKLANHARALARDSRYRVLFHQAWRQPVKPRKNASAILIFGGNNYGEHSELEGSITLSLARLLQINTRLWLTQFEINYGQTPSDWPPLPAQPQKLKQALLAQVRNADDLTLIPEQPLSWELPAEPLADITTEANAPYLPQRIVLMNEERQMRSSEIHYLDHPLFGLIIQLTPYDVPASTTLSE